MRAVRVSETGGPEVLEWSEVDDPAVAEGSVLVELAAAGLNYIDTYQRSGLYAMSVPYTPGLEGAGTVVEVGDGVNGFAAGDRVAWTGVLGSYAERVVVPASAAVPVPEGVELEVAAATMLQGMTAHYLACSTFPLAEGHRCLVHAGAGGVGLILIQIAKLRGAEVFTTVGSADKGHLAREAGADHVILYRDEDFGDAVERIAGRRPLDVVYDGVGKATFDRSLEVLKPLGMMVTFGNASGPVDPVSPLTLTKKGSLYLTRPSVAHYYATPEEAEEGIGALFDMIVSGKVTPHIGARYPLSGVADAHRALEARETVGSTVLIV